MGKRLFALWAAPLVVFVTLMGFNSVQTVVAHGNHVEYAVDENQTGVAKVVNNGENGLVVVHLECIVPGKQLTFEMEISFPEGESANLEVRRQGRPPDFSGWVTMTPSSLGEPDTVRVKVDVPEDAAQGTAAIVRIQDGPGGTGNGPGVKLHICVADAPPVQPPGLGPPVSKPPQDEPPGHPTPEFTRELGPSTQIGPSPTPTLQLPTKLPEAGATMDQSDFWLKDLPIVMTLLSVTALALIGAGVLHYRRRI